ncbi:zinc transporter 1 isoform X2 [Myzus persicae]|uniref:zinc transporter 1 isoform X2 n=1 Tax=Myzus persicae TaxID=13164 RepID=UPI000B933D98|nr:zinc transporter 1 isoform X2 [Myzus persicae]
MNGFKMSVKKVLRIFNPHAVHTVILLTLCYFLVQLVLSHVSHSLTLLVDSYHVLCKLIYFFGSVLCIKHDDYEEVCLNEGCVEKILNAEEDSPESNMTVSKSGQISSSSCVHHHPEKKLKNTFGWARIEVVLMLGGCVFLASLSFSLVVEAIQTLIHIDHQDPMHHPISVFIIGLVGILIHGLCCLLLGGPVVQNTRVPDEESANALLNPGQLLKKKIQTKNCSPREICRDLVGCTMVMICSIIVIFTDPCIAKFVDPGISIISAAILLYLKYPNMKESCLILLQTMPDHMNIDAICKNLMKTFPDIVNVHELHIWQLTEDKIISTAHIMFLNPQDYLRINKAVVNFFHENGILEVTIQPEFFKDDQNIQMVPEYGMGQCLVQCNNIECFDRNCCEPDDIESIQHC